jgi:hypothetical protein
MGKRLVLVPKYSFLMVVMGAAKISFFLFFLLLWGGQGDAEQRKKK